MASVILRNLTKSFDGAAGPALRELSLGVGEGEFLVLLGPSGCGKTTALRCIAGLDEATEGEIHIGERDVTRLPPAARDVAMVFQNYALYPHLTVRENIAFALEVRRVPRKEILRRVSEAAQRLGLAELLERRPAQLSGGQRQRVALGRAIVRAPQAFLFDEPLSNLEAPLRSELRSEILKLHRALGATMIYVTHDQVEAMTMGQRIGRSSRGCRGCSGCAWATASASSSPNGTSPSSTPPAPDSRETRPRLPRRPRRVRLGRRRGSARAGPPRGRDRRGLPRDAHRAPRARALPRGQSGDWDRRARCRHLPDRLPRAHPGVPRGRQPTRRLSARPGRRAGPRERPRGARPHPLPRPRGRGPRLLQPDGAGHLHARGRRAGAAHRIHADRRGLQQGSVRPGRDRVSCGWVDLGRLQADRAPAHAGHGRRRPDRPVGGVLRPAGVRGAAGGLVGGGGRAVFGGPLGFRMPRCPPDDRGEPLVQALGHDRQDRAAAPELRHAGGAGGRGGRRRAAVLHGQAGDGDGGARLGSGPAGRRRAGPAAGRLRRDPASDRLRAGDRDLRIGVRRPRDRVAPPARGAARGLSRGHTCAGAARRSGGRGAGPDARRGGAGGSRHPGLGGRVPARGAARASALERARRAVARGRGRLLGSAGPDRGRAGGSGDRGARRGPAARRAPERRAMTALPRWRAGALLAAAGSALLTLALARWAARRYEAAFARRSAATTAAYLALVTPPAPVGADYSLPQLFIQTRSLNALPGWTPRVEVYHGTAPLLEAGAPPLTPGVLDRLRGQAGASWRRGVALAPGRTGERGPHPGGSGLAPGGGPRAPVRPGPAGRLGRAVH